MIRAREYHFGIGESIQDHNEAFKAYEYAAKLNCPYAPFNLGVLIMNEDVIPSSRKKLNLVQISDIAYDYFIEGKNRGDGRNWALLALHYFRHSHYDNFEKCWKNYFRSGNFRNPDSFDDLFFPRFFMISMYFRKCEFEKLKIKEEMLELIDEFPDGKDFNKFLLEIIAYCEEKNDLEKRDKYKKMYQYVYQSN